MKIQKKKTRDVPIVAAVLKNEKGEYLIHKRASEGLLANLWEYPNFENHSSLLHKREFFESRFQEMYGVKPEITESLVRIEHVFSHLVWKVDTYIGMVKEAISEETLREQQLKWVSEAEMEELAFPVSHQKMMKACKIKRIK